MLFFVEYLTGIQYRQVQIIKCSRQLPTTCPLSNVLANPQAHLVYRYILKKKISCCHLFDVVQLVVLPLSATDRVLLKYCSSTIQALSLTLLETPQEPWQLTLMAVRRRGNRQGVRQPRSMLHDNRMSLKNWISWNSCSWISHTDSAEPPLGIVTNFSSKQPSHPPETTEEQTSPPQGWQSTTAAVDTLFICLFF